jgi:hypothetical protein
MDHMKMNSNVKMNPVSGMHGSGDSSRTAN